MSDPIAVPQVNPNVDHPIEFIHPAVPELLGGGSGGTTVPGGKTLDHCVWKQIWQNSTPAAKDRTIEVQPLGAGVLPGTITVFYAPLGAPPAGPPGPPLPPPAVPGGWPKIPPDGGAAALNVPSPQIVFVHYDQGKNGPAQVRVTISQSA